MAEKHQQVTVGTTTWQFFLQKVWEFVENTQAAANVLRFAEEGGNIAVKSGGSFWDGDADLSSGFASDNDYMVVEPVNEYPGGGRWQMKIKSTDVSTNSYGNCSVEVSWLGGYDTSEDDFGSNLTTGTSRRPFYSSLDSTADSLYFSCSNTDSYINSSGTQTYTYFRILRWDNGAADDIRFDGTYVGGYIPNEPDDDDKPIVVYHRVMRGYWSGDYWGDSDSLDTGILPGNYEHTVCGGNVSSFINSMDNAAHTGYSLTRSGNWSNGPVLINDYANTRTLGAWGKYTALKGDILRNSGATDAANEYLIGNDMVVRWKPSA